MGPKESRHVAPPCPEGRARQLVYNAESFMSVAAQWVHGLKLCAIPHPDNYDRPYALRHRPLAAVSALLLVTKIAAIAVISLVPAPADLATITNQRIIQLTNAERTKVGLKALTVNSKLSSAALQKGQHMLQEDYFAHISPSGVTPWFWMSKVGYRYQVAGENLAIDFTQAEDVVAAWMASPSHRDNLLLRDYTETGVAVVTGEFQGGTSTIVVHMFGRSQAVAASTTPEPTKQPTPSPSITPVPTAVPTTPTPPPSEPAPRVPRIAVRDDVVATAATVTITGDPGSTTHLLVNSQVRANVLIPAAGSTTHTINLADLPDGAIVLRAYASNAAGVDSEVSEAVALTKDTVGPDLEAQHAIFAISPLTDSPRLALQLSNTFATATATMGDTTVELLPGAWRLLTLSPSALTIEVRDAALNATTLPDVTLTPQFATERVTLRSDVPAHWWQFSRRLTLSIFAVMLVLLVTAILIRVHVQHIGLITHASLVLLLAAFLFFL
jgi:uncharacterized protein YkwD